MRFYFPHRFVSVLLLLVSLTRVAQGSSLRTRRSALNEIGNTLNNVGEKMKNVKIKLEPLSQPSSVGPETTTATLEPDDGTSPVNRNIIKVPPRCPPNHKMVKGRCRLITHRR
ncbi:hypothetical protein ACFW04_010495 [Cataglyphis niger]